MFSSRIVRLKSFDFFGTINFALDNCGGIKKVRAASKEVDGYYKRLGLFQHNIVGMFCLNDELYFFYNERYFNVSSNKYHAKVLTKGLVLNTFHLYELDAELLKISFIDFSASNSEGLNSHFLKDCALFLFSTDMKSENCKIFKVHEVDN